MKSIIFLDIDGVLCTLRSCVGQYGLMQTLDRAGVNMLNTLINETDSRLVLSSTWREFHDQNSMTAILQNSGMPTVRWHQCWKTPVLPLTFIRGDEINKWMEINGYPDRYVIFDDVEQFHPNQHLILTDDTNGISYQNYKTALEILNAKGERNAK